jgi:hypothetical protein
MVGTNNDDSSKVLDKPSRVKVCRHGSLTFGIVVRVAIGAGGLVYRGFTGEYNQPHCDGPTRSGVVFQLLYSLV